MFFLVSLSKEICVLPLDLTHDIKTVLENNTKELIGKIIGNNGYVVSIIDIAQTSRGKVDNETGRVNFKILYKAITFKLIENEILDARSFFVNEHGIFCRVGPCQIFVSKHMMLNWEYNSDKNMWINGVNTLNIDDLIRLKIIAVQINSDQITALGTLI